MNGLRAFLLFNELSQQELAEFLGISKGQMSKLVSGVAKLQAEQLSKIVSNERGWNTEFLTNPMWEDVAAWKQVAESGSIAIQQNGKKNNIGHVSTDADESAALRKEIEMLRAQVEELKAEKAAYWEMIKQLTAK